LGRQNAEVDLEDHQQQQRQIGKMNECCRSFEIGSGMDGKNCGEEEGKRVDIDMDRGQH
jgi:hypothetical protein